MNYEQQENLWISIDHWLDNWEHPETAVSSGDDCKLCNVYNDFTHESCSRCPVYELTGEIECRNTPWRDASMAIETYQNAIEAGHKGGPGEALYENARSDILVEYQFLVDLALSGMDPTT